MKPNSPPERKKLSMKTRLIVIAAVFVIINLVFYLGFEGSEDSENEQKVEQDSIESEEIQEETEEEKVFAKFNPPEP